MGNESRLTESIKADKRTYPADYEIQPSMDGIKWKHEASFWRGEPSRFGKPFDDETMKEEVLGFRTTWRDKKPHIRLIIQY